VEGGIPVGEKVETMIPYVQHSITQPQEKGCGASRKMPGCSHTGQREMRRRKKWRGKKKVLGGDCKTEFDSNRKKEV